MREGVQQEREACESGRGEEEHHLKFPTTLIFATKSRKLSKTVAVSYYSRLFIYARSWFIIIVLVINSMASPTIDEQVKGFFGHLKYLYDHSFDFSIYEPYFAAIFGDDVTDFIGNWWFAITKLLLITIYYSVSMLYYSQMEGWHVVDCVYFATVTWSTVGYGFFHPTTDNSRVFTVFFMLFGIIFILPIFGEFASLVGHRVQEEITHSLHSTGNRFVIENINRGVVSIICVFLVFYVGIAFYTSNEDFTFATALYFTTQTMTTVGYGDIELLHESSRWFGILFIISSTLTLATALNEFGVIFGSLMHARRRNILLERVVTGDILKQLTKNGKAIDKNAFVLEMLVELELIDREIDIEPLLKKFDELDDNNSGLLRSAEIDRFVSEMPPLSTQSRSRSRQPSNANSINTRVNTETLNPMLGTDRSPTAASAYDRMEMASDDRDLSEDNTDASTSMQVGVSSPQLTTTTHTSTTTTSTAAIEYEELAGRDDTLAGTEDQAFRQV